MRDMLCKSRFPRTGRAIQEYIQVFPAPRRLRIFPSGIKILEHRHDIIHIPNIPAQNADAIQIIIWPRFLRQSRYTQKFSMRRSDLANHIQRRHLLRLHPLSKPNCQSGATCHHRNFLSDTFDIFATHHRFRLLRFQYGLPNRNAFALAEREKFQRIIETATGAIFNHRDIIRNPNNRRFQVLENDIQ